MCPGSAAGPNTGACCPNGVTGLGIGACCPNALTSLGIWANYIKGREKVRWEPEGKPARWRERQEKEQSGLTLDVHLLLVHLNTLDSKETCVRLR